MSLALVGSAMAANDGSITISNTTQDATYTIYKVFDATYSGSNVAYTYDGSNATFLAALQANTSPFTLEGPTGGPYNVIRKDTASNDDIITFIKGQVGNFGSAVTTLTGNGGSVSTSSTLAYGYYYITSTVGSVVTIDSALKDVTVIDKNQTTTFDKTETIDDTTYYTGAYSDDTTPPTANVGDTVNYKVAGTWTRYEGTEIVKTLKFHDVMSNGLTANQDVAVKFGDTTLTTYNKIVNGAAAVKVGSGDTIQYTVTYTLNNNGTTDNTTDDYWVTDIVIPVATFDNEGNPTFLYNVTNTYEITYSAQIDEDAIIDGEEQNTVGLKWTDKNDSDHDKGEDKTKVKDFPVDLLKKDGKNTTDTADDSPLAGAKFKLYPQNGSTAIKVILVSGTGTAASTVDNVYRVAKPSEASTAIEEMVVGTTGKITVKGLKNGSYEFEETEAPAGYNKLTSRTNVATINNASASVTAINNSGTELPSTGGIGTTIFYIVGAVLVLGAAAVILARRKAEQQ